MTPLKKIPALRPLLAAATLALMLPAAPAMA